MLQIIKKAVVVKPLVLFVLCTTLFSFVALKGGDSFEIRLKNKQVIQQFVTRNDGVKSVQLDNSLVNDQVEVFYHHCGQTGKNRNITLKDPQNKVLKTWHFADRDDANSAMQLPVKDILDLRGVSQVNLFYSSQELPNGRLLAYLVIAKKTRDNNAGK